MAIYYNEWDPFAAQWLRNLIEAGHLPPGDVDERDIREITPDDLKGYTQHHFFAGIGGWPVALSLAGWPADRSVWTGSCPCQPFSVAGKGLGEKDERHLWPAWFQLIGKCEPATVFGEQVTSPLGREWLSGVRADLETLGYAVGAADLCAAGVGSPQIRQRHWWVADASSVRCDQRRSAEGSEIQRECTERGRKNTRSKQTRELSGRSEGYCGASGLSDAIRRRCETSNKEERAVPEFNSNDSISRLYNPKRRRRLARSIVAETRPPEEQPDQGLLPGGGHSFWDNFDVIPFADGKARRVESGTFPLAHGIPARVGRLCGYGNAINPQTAAVFIRACQEIMCSRLT